MTEPSLYPDFTVTPRVGPVSLTVQFTNTTMASAGPVTYTWDFGDGVGDSNEEHPQYEYQQVGAYTVTLTAETAAIADATTSIMHYVYNGDGALVLRASGECTHTFYIGGYYEYHGFATDDSDGDWSCDSSETSCFYAGGQAVALRTVFPYETEPYQWEVTSTVHYLHHDYLGNLTEVTDQRGEVIGRARYDAYGAILDNTIPPTITNRLYTGLIYNADTGLYKIGARWYDPVIGVWLTSDSIVPDLNKPVAWNRYAFNYQNPVNYVDPSGHSALLALGVGFALGGGFAWLRGYGPDTWQFYAAGAARAANAGIGFATTGALAFAADVGIGTAADTLIFGDSLGGALASNVAGNVAFAGISRGLRYLSSRPPQFSKHLEAGLQVLDEYEPRFARLIRRLYDTTKRNNPVANEIRSKDHRRRRHHNATVKGPHHPLALGRPGVEPSRRAPGRLWRPRGTRPHRGRHPQGPTGLAGV